jgi:hypothetical protein
MQNQHSRISWHPRSALHQSPEEIVSLSDFLPPHRDFPKSFSDLQKMIHGGAPMPSWDEAFEKAQQLSERCDAFFERREAAQSRKDAKRARRDGYDPLSSPETRQYEAPPDFREDEHLNPERSELRNGALSKSEE